MAARQKQRQLSMGAMSIFSRAKNINSSSKSALCYRLLITPRERSSCDRGLWELPKIPGFPFNFSAMAEASNFKFGTQLVFAKADHKITPIGKGGCGLRLGELPKILGFPYNISAKAEASNFKFGMQLGFAKAHHKNHHQRKKWAWSWAREAAKYLEFSCNISTTAALSS